jgi:hypothetical protein
MLRFSFLIPISVIAASAGLAGCKQITTGPNAPIASAPAAANAAIDPKWPSLPEGAACTADLTHFQTILKSDVTTGNLNRSVYEKIQDELVSAAEACASGRDAEARRLIQTAKSRNGYRV